LILTVSVKNQDLIYITSRSISDGTKEIIDQDL